MRVDRKIVPAAPLAGRLNLLNGLKILILKFIEFNLTMQ